MDMKKFLDILDEEVGGGRPKIKAGKPLPEPYLSQAKAIVDKKAGANKKDVYTTYEVAYWYDPEDEDEEIPVEASPKNYAPGKFPDMWEDIEKDAEGELRGTWITVELSNNKVSDVVFEFDDSTM
jgi:hypothetical protein